MSKINTEWFPYYEVLERIRQSGITNMYGAVPYLATYCEIDEKLARQVLVNWMENYKDIATIFNWTR